MIFSFGKGRKLSDLTKLAEFLEKEGIDYEMITDVQLAVGSEFVTETTPTAPTPAIDDERIKMTEEQNDPLWRQAKCDDCGNTGKIFNDKCMAPPHYGGEFL